MNQRTPDEPDRFVELLAAGIGRIPVPVDPDPAATADRLIAEAERRMREASPGTGGVPKGAEEGRGRASETTSSPVEAANSPTATPSESCRPRSGRRWVVWSPLAGGMAALVAVVLAASGWWGGTEPTDRWARMQLSVTSAEEPTKSRALNDFAVHYLDKFTHRADARPDRPHAWCHQIDDRGPQWIYTLQPKDGRLVGEYTATFDHPKVPVFEYFVVIRSDSDNVTLGKDTGHALAEWLTAQEVKDLQAVGTPGPATPAARRILTAALERLLPRGTFDVEADCYLHHPDPRR